MCLPSSLLGSVCTLCVQEHCLHEPGFLCMSACLSVCLGGCRILVCVCGCVDVNRHPTPSQHAPAAPMNAYMCFRQVEEAFSRHGDPEWLLVDTRAASELIKTGKIAGALHVPRQSIEFHVDPEMEGVFLLFVATRVFVYVHVCELMHIHTPTHPHTHTYIHTCAERCVEIFIYTLSHTSVRVKMQEYVCRSFCKSVKKLTMLTKASSCCVCSL